MNCAPFLHQAPRAEGGSLRGPGRPCPTQWTRAPWVPATKEVTKLILTCCLSGEESHIRWTGR